MHDEASCRSGKTRIGGQSRRPRCRGKLRTECHAQRRGILSPHDGHRDLAHAVLRLRLSGHPIHHWHEDWKPFSFERALRLRQMAITAATQAIMEDRIARASHTRPQRVPLEELTPGTSEVEFHREDQDGFGWRGPANLLKLQDNLQARPFGKSVLRRRKSVLEYAFSERPKKSVTPAPLDSVLSKKCT